MYASAVDNAEELLHRGQNGCTSARNIFQRIREPMRRRAEAYVAVRGQYFGHLL
jgi:predicted kinase